MADRAQLQQKACEPRLTLAGRPQAGPVFWPTRRMSALAETLLAGPPPTGERLTAYDEAWYPRAPVGS